MAEQQPGRSNPLQHADLSKRAVKDLSAAERAELSRRLDHFVRHFRAGKTGSAPAAAPARRIRKWQP